MLTLNCPSCGAAVDFRSKASVFAVCSFCHSTLVRQDMNLSDIGKMAYLQDDMTPFQIGTKGTFDKKTFELIGRAKIGYAGGFWNEWYAMFSGDHFGWLAEAQGFLAMCFSLSEVPLPEKSKLYPGAKVEIAHKGTFVVDDVEQASVLYGEGELPFDARVGRLSTCVDLTGDDDEMGTIEYGADQPRLYIGNYQEYDDFHFKNVRRFDGW